MAFWNGLFTKQEPQGDVTVTVPLSGDLSQVQYPTDDYSNFSTQGYGKNEVVHACIRELATAAATPRYYIYDTKSDPTSGMIEMPDSPLGKLLLKPNSQDDIYQWLEKLVTFLYVAGNAYVLKERSRTNQITALWLLRPDRVSIKPQEMGRNVFLYSIDGKEYEIPSENISHMSFPNPGGDVYGMSPLSVLAKTVNLDLSMTDFAKLYFQNAGVPSGLLKVKRRINSQEEAGIIRSRWRSAFGGSNNMHRVAILDDDAEYQAMASAPKDMDLQGLHNLTESRICSVFGVPPILIGVNVGLQRSTFSNYKEARLSFHSETVEPLIKRIIRFLNNSLAAELGENAALGVAFSEVLSPLDDRGEQANRVSMLYASGIITLNEARGYIGEQPIEDGDSLKAEAVDIGEDTQFDPGALSLPVNEAKQLKADPTERAMRLRDSLVEAREPESERLTGELEKHFKFLSDRVNGVLGRMMERGDDKSRSPDKIKDLPVISSDELLPKGLTNELSEILANSYARVSRTAYREINAAGIAGAVEWSAQSPVVTGILTQAGGRAAMIHSTTRKGIQKSIEVAMNRGYSVQQLARGVAKENFPGIRAILGETESRSKMIARTEVMRSQNMTSTRLYSDQGFGYVQAIDIDGGKDTYVDPADPYGSTCSGRNGRIYRTNEAERIMDHPNGTLSWMPMPSSYRPEGQPGGELVDQVVGPDRSSPASTGFDSTQWRTPEIKLGPKVLPVAAEKTALEIRQSVMSVKRNVAVYIANLYQKSPKSVPKILSRRSRKFNVKDPKTGRPAKAGGVYHRMDDSIHVATGQIEHATIHEIGHQVSMPHHLDEILGKTKSKEFLSSTEKAFKAAEKRHVEPRFIYDASGIRTEGGNIGTITEYALSNHREYIAEGFKYAIKDPGQLAKTDPALLKIMQKYLVSDAPAKMDEVRAASLKVGQELKIDPDSYAGLMHLASMPQSSKEVLV